MKDKIEQAKQDKTYFSKANILKGIDEDKNIVTAIISKKTVDRDGEVVLPKAFEEDLDYYLDNPVVLFSHEHENPPVAKMVDWKITDDEFLAHDEFAVDEYPFAKTIFNLYKGGFMSAFSVGFRRIDISDAEDERLPGQTGITFTRAELLEHSAVPIPANRQALVKIYGAVKEHWDETILGYLEKLIDQPQILECGHKATYDYEGTIIKDCSECLKTKPLVEEILNRGILGYSWNGKNLSPTVHDLSKERMPNKFFFFGPPPSIARLANLEQVLANTEEEKKKAICLDDFDWDIERKCLTHKGHVILVLQDIFRLFDNELEKVLEGISEKYEISYSELADKFENSPALCKMKIYGILLDKVSPGKDHNGVPEPAQERNIGTLISTGWELLGKHE